MGRKSKSESVEKKKRESQSLTFSLFSECLFQNCVRNHVRENGIISFSCLRKCLSVLFAFEVNKREDVFRKRTDLIFFSVAVIEIAPGDGAGVDLKGRHGLTPLKSELM